MGKLPLYARKQIVNLNFGGENVKLLQQYHEASKFLG